MSLLNDQHAVEPSEARYRLLVESISDYAIYLMDPDGTVVSWNAGAERFKGYRSEEIVGQNFARFYSEEDRDAGVPKRNLQLAARDGHFEEEGWRYRKDGSRFWASVVIDRIVDPAGTVVGFAKITRDLTEKRAQEAVLRRSQEQFRLLVKGVRDYALFMLDPEGNVVSWNAGAERIKGYTEEEIVGQHFSQFYTQEDRASGEPQKNLETARAAGNTEVEGWRVRKDGSLFFAHVVIDAIYDDGGNLIGFAKVIRDITDRRDTQRQLDQAREALFQSQKLEAIGQLTGGVAHDFNNLLMAVLGSLEIVARRSKPDPQVTPFIDNAIQAARRGAALTQRMLAFARKQELAMQAVDLVDTVRGMADILDRTLGPSIVVTTRFPVSLPLVHTDRAQLEFALLNLAVNARDAMPDGGTLVIAAERQETSPRDDARRAGRYVVLSVTDTGEGMNATTLSHAAEPFFTTKGVGKGTGLGLSMVHGLAEQSGGRFVLSSEPGNGTRAELWLALAPGELSSPEPPAAVPVFTAMDGKRVLVVDDDALVLLNTVTMVEDLGHQVFEATSGEEALSILDKESIDLLITDYSMPKMTGGALAATTTTRWPHIKVLIATGYAQMPDDYKGKFERLGKPFSEQELKVAIGRTLTL
ncbi:PAS domain-containing sensor histidine kinase [Mesorhizobium sp. M8A.F.Ca.ET.173.01.1.1]|nr:PAS domain-containing sensor histidine kinase [Mesorhizobium sp. M8A.F.Ca.ET.173.01.1.1]